MAWFLDLHQSRAGTGHYPQVGSFAKVDQRVAMRARCVNAEDFHFLSSIPNIGKPKPLLGVASTALASVAAIAITHLESIQALGQDLPFIC